jgi:probable DNA metabolism protein
MTTLLYDGTYYGFLTALFEVYEYKMQDATICTHEKNHGSLFGNVHTVVTDPVKAKRVLVKLKNELPSSSFSEFYKTFLSELPEMEAHLLAYLQYFLAKGEAMANDFSNPHVLFVQQTARKVSREKHRMEAFVRFSLTKDQLYYSIVEPDFNVLPLIIKHFKNRYADQRWMIYDAKRKYGIYYDLEQVSEITIDFDVNTNSSTETIVVLDETELFYQDMWKQYFHSVDIAARRNTKLHVKHMPKRYWKYLPEKL